MISNTLVRLKYNIESPFEGQYKGSISKVVCELKTTDLCNDK